MKSMGVMQYPIFIYFISKYRINNNNSMSFSDYCAFHTPPQLDVSHLFMYMSVSSPSYFAKSSRIAETCIFHIVLFYKFVFFSFELLY